MDTDTPYMRLLAQQAEVSKKANETQLEMRLYTNLEASLDSLLCYKRNSLEPSELQTALALKRWCGDKWEAAVDSLFDDKRQLRTIEKAMRDMVEKS